jgi:hypothetical protein
MPAATDAPNTIEFCRSGSFKANLSIATAIAPLATTCNIVLLIFIY